jgi:K+-transporting ATPase ATPase B chain
VPLSLRGVRTKARGATSILYRNLLIYGVGGLIAPFVAIKAIDFLLNAFGLFS